MSTITCLYTEEEFSKALNIIGCNIAKYRKLAHLTQAELAEIAQISRSYLGKLESTSMTPQMSLQCLFTISKALDIKVLQLLEGVDA